MEVTDASTALSLGGVEDQQEYIALIMEQQKEMNKLFVTQAQERVRLALKIRRELYDD